MTRQKWHIEFESFIDIEKCENSIIGNNIDLNLKRPLRI